MIGLTVFNFDAKSAHELAAGAKAEFPEVPVVMGGPYASANREVLLDDANVVAEKAQAAGVDVTLSVYDGMWHVWHTMGTMLPEGHAAFIEINDFIKTNND